ncbi:hypothetical protein [Salipiger sp.]|uniref:hypothetical protein n=1 Tax=Salipiger sp. TaxID=2078585 RepID=UPI003A96CADF
MTDTNPHPDEIEDVVNEPVPPGNPRDLADALGVPEMARVLETTPSAIYNYLKADLLPAYWYGPLKQLGDSVEIQVPMGLFRWHRKRRSAPEAEDQ